MWRRAARQQPQAIGETRSSGLAGSSGACLLAANPAGCVFAKRFLWATGDMSPWCVIANSSFWSVERATPWRYWRGLRNADAERHRVNTSESSWTRLAMKCFITKRLGIAVALLSAAPLYAASPQQGLPALPHRFPPPSDSATWTIVIVLTLLTLLPALILSMTPFVRILIVFHFLRQALGTQNTPSNQTLMGLALFLTYFIMQPVGVQIDRVAVGPLAQHRISALQAIDLASGPLRDFMLKFAREKDLALLTDMAQVSRPREPSELPMRVVIPAYILSEMKVGFQIGAVLYLPFMVVDMVVAAVTTSVGMLQLPPVIISTPLKILLFVVADGWNLVVGSLLKSFS